MEKFNYKMYPKSQMLNIIKNDAFLFIDTNLGEHYIIKKQDLADFIILETLRTKHFAEIQVYMPGIEEPVITTFGWFLNKANPLLREEIIKRLVLLQTTNIKPKKVRIFDNEIFMRLSKKEMGIINGKIKNFDKFYKKYEYAQNKHNIKMEGV